MATLIVQPASPFGADIVCESFPNSPITGLQIQLCKRYPGLVSHLAMEAGKVFEHQLKRHFKHERWDGQNVNPPIFGPTDAFLKLGELQNELHLHIFYN